MAGLALEDLIEPADRVIEIAAPVPLVRHQELVEHLAKRCAGGGLVSLRCGGIFAEQPQIPAASQVIRWRWRAKAQRLGQARHRLV